MYFSDYFGFFETHFELFGLEYLNSEKVLQAPKQSRIALFFNLWKITLEKCDFWLRPTTRDFLKIIELIFLQFNFDVVV